MSFVESSNLFDSIDLFLFSFLYPNFVACTDQGSELKYLCEWDEQTHTIVSARVANASFPQLVVSFLEAKFDFLHGAPPSLNCNNENVYLTRTVEKWAIAAKISFDPKVKIVRDLGLEKHLLEQNKPQPINARRATAPTKSPITLKKISNVPFGARGRKRQTINILYVGI